MSRSLSVSVRQRFQFPRVIGNQFVRQCMTSAPSKKLVHAHEMRKMYKLAEVERQLKAEADYQEKFKRMCEFVISERDRLLDEMERHLVFPYRGEIYHHQYQAACDVAEQLRDLGYVVDRLPGLYYQILEISLPPESDIAVSEH